MDPAENRRHPRVNVDLFADWGRSPECEYYDKVTSLSMSGCFLATRHELNRSEEIYLRLSSDASGAVTLKGVVRYQLKTMEGAPPTGAGIEFTNVSNDSEIKLQKMVNSYLQPT
jgi:PilZ domain-containing protein